MFCNIASAVQHIKQNVAAALSRSKPSSKRAVRRTTIGASANWGQRKRFGRFCCKCFTATRLASTCCGSRS